MKRMFVTILSVLALIAGVPTVYAVGVESVTFCHVPPGNIGKPETIRTSEVGMLRGHHLLDTAHKPVGRASGHEHDYLGACKEPVATVTPAATEAPVATLSPEATVPVVTPTPGGEPPIDPPPPVNEDPAP